MTGPLHYGPSPYPALCVLPFFVTDLLGPIGGFMAWTALNLILALAIVHGLLRSSRHDRPVIYLMTFVFLPIFFTLIMGQLTILMTFGLYKSYRALERGQDFRAGLWMGLLLLKPQFALVLALVWLVKSRWRALGGLVLVGGVLAISTWILVSTDGVRDYLSILRRFSGFRKVPEIVHPWFMINFRGLLVNLLPVEGYESLGKSLVLILSSLLTLSLLGVWRGGWYPASDRFPARCWRH